MKFDSIVVDKLKEIGLITTTDTNENIIAWVDEYIHPQPTPGGSVDLNNVDVIDFTTDHVYVYVEPTQPNL